MGRNLLRHGQQALTSNQLRCVSWRSIDDDTTLFYSRDVTYLRNRSAPAVNCWVIIHCLEISCKEDQILSAQREWFIFLQLTDKQWIITQQFTHWRWSISILTHNKRRKHIRSLQLLPTFRHCTEELPPILRLRRIRLYVIVTYFKRKTTLHRLTPWMTSFSSDVRYHTLLQWIIVRYITVCYRWLYRRGVLELMIRHCFDVMCLLGHVVVWLCVCVCVCGGGGGDKSLFCCVVLGVLR